MKSVQRTNNRLERSGRATTIALASDRRPAAPRSPGERLSVPAAACDLNPFHLPSSVRLEGMFRRKGIKRLGQLDGVALSELRQLGNCGPRTINELVQLIQRVGAGEFTTPADPLAPASLAAMLRRLDESIAGLTAREREILLLRLGAGKGQRLWTLEEAGRKFGLTRERVRQIMELILPLIRKQGGPGLALQLREMAAACQRAICPLTPELFSQWLAGAEGPRRFPLPVYVRLLGELNPEIPAWPEGQEYRTDPRPGRLEAAMKVLRGILQQGTVRLPLKRSFELTVADPRMTRLSPAEFLAALKYARSIVVEFSQPDQPQARLRWLASSTAANAILQTSDGPLKLDVIADRIASEFGERSRGWSPASLRRTLTKNFYWLGPSTFGLRRHVTLAGPQCKKACSDVLQLLKKQERPISAARILSLGRFPWGAKTNAYELAEILREDRRFIEGRRLIFSVARSPGKPKAGARLVQATPSKSASIRP